MRVGVTYHCFLSLYLQIQETLKSKVYKRVWNFRNTFLMPGNRHQDFLRYSVMLWRGWSKCDQSFRYNRFSFKVMKKLLEFSLFYFSNVYSLFLSNIQWVTNTLKCLIIEKHFYLISNQLNILVGGHFYFTFLNTSYFEIDGYFYIDWTISKISC